MKKLEQNEYLKEVSNWGEIYRYIKELKKNEEGIICNNKSSESCEI